MVVMLRRLRWGGGVGVLRRRLFGCLLGCLGWRQSRWLVDGSSWSSWSTRCVDDRVCEVEGVVVAGSTALAAAGQLDEAVDDQREQERDRQRPQGQQYAIAVPRVRREVGFSGVGGLRGPVRLVVAEPAAANRRRRTRPSGSAVRSGRPGTPVTPRCYVRAVAALRRRKAADAGGRTGPAAADTPAARRSR